jgi:hypothetical protein
MELIKIDVKIVFSPDYKTATGEFNNLFDDGETE